MEYFLSQLQLKGIPFRVSMDNRNELRVCCVFCTDKGESPDTRFRLCINTRTGQGICFNCGWRSRSALKFYLHKLKIAGNVSLQEKTEETEPEFRDIEIPEGAVLLADHWNDGKWHRKAKEYLEQRNVDLQTMKEKRVLFTEVGRFSHRVIFPIVIKRRLVGLVSRGILKSQKRYINSSGAKAIWNIPDKPKDTVLLCEGIFKGLALERLFPREKISVGALLGHTITDLQAKQIEGAELVMIWPDPDPAGLIGAIKLAYKLRNQFIVALPTRIPTAQADDLPASEIVSVYKSFRRWDDNMKCHYESTATRRSHTVEEE